MVGHNKTRKLQKKQKIHSLSGGADFAPGKLRGRGPRPSPDEPLDGRASAGDRALARAMARAAAADEPRSLAIKDLLARTQEARWAQQADAVLAPPIRASVARMSPLNDEITLIELERRVKICELLLLHMNRLFSTKIDNLVSIEGATLSPQFIDDFVFVPNKDGQTILGRIRHNYHPVTKEDRISIIGVLTPDGDRANLGPRGTQPNPSIMYSLLIDQIQFLNKRKVKSIYPGVLSERADPGAIETDVITYGDITSTLFETRLQIREYKQRPRNNQGRQLNFSQPRFSVENQLMNGAVL